MKRTFRVLHYGFLSAITLVAGVVMWQVSRRNNLAALEQHVVSTLPETIAPNPRVDVRRITPQAWPVYAVYTGKIRPWESYKIGFETAGRVAALNVKVDQPQLDEGDRVEAGQIVARLDDRTFRAMYNEASAQRELAATEMNRARKLRDGGSRAITDTEYQKRLTDLALAEARLAVAEKNLEDTVLRSPVAASIAKRYFKAGESVNQQQAVFELVENDPILLVVDVPESQIAGLQLRQFQVKQENASRDAEVFRVDVQLQGIDQFGKPWPLIEGEVHQIGLLASPQTGMIEVEVRLPNPEGRLRSGMVATAWIEYDRVHGYRMPESALVVRRGKSRFYTVNAEKSDLRALYWSVGQRVVHRAHRHDVDQMIDQRPLPQENATTADGEKNHPPEIIVPSESDKPLDVVIRGQHRLTDQQIVRLVGSPTDGATTENVATGLERSASAETQADNTAPASSGSQL